MPSTPDAPAVRSASQSGYRHFTAFVLVLSAIVCAVPLIVWPVVLIASAMSLAGHRTGNENPFMMGVVKAFCTGSMAYPLAYFWGIMNSWWRFRRQEYRQAVLFAAVAPLYLGLLIALFWIWAATGS
jgi:hypothetical protein